MILLDSILVGWSCFGCGQTVYNDMYRRKMNIDYQDKIISFHQEKTEQMPGYPRLCFQCGNGSMSIRHADVRQHSRNRLLWNACSEPYMQNSVFTEEVIQFVQKRRLENSLMKGMRKFPKIVKY